MRVKTAPSFPVQVFVAGDADTARRLCRVYCDEAGLCVTVTATEYVYTGGQETGVVVGLINYPRFPSTPDALERHAFSLARLLLEGLGQSSAAVHTPTSTFWLTCRPEDQ